MRASAIWLDWMVLDEETSSGRTMPATVSWRTSSLVFTSWVPWMTMLPLGSTWVTTAAMVRLMASERLMPPAPCEESAVLVVISFDGSTPGMTLPMLDSSPKKLGTPMALLVVSAVLEVLEVLAESEIETSTVRMSPTRPARWSLKKVRAPVRHSELGVGACGGGSRADSNVGWFWPTRADG